MFFKWRHALGTPEKQISTYFWYEELVPLEPDGLNWNPSSGTRMILTSLDLSFLCGK